MYYSDDSIKQAVLAAIACKVTGDKLVTQSASNETRLAILRATIDIANNDRLVKSIDRLTDAIEGVNT